MKYCNGCHSIKPKSSFFKRNGIPSGLMSRCKECVQSAKRNRLATPERRARENERQRIWRMNHPEQERLVQRKSKRKRWNNDISYRIGNVISNAIRRYLNGKQKNMRKWEDLLGFDFEALKTHLERQFQPGMTWGNYGEWQIDHKVPLSHFRIKDINDPRFGECFSLSNLQPLWKEENNRKGGKLEWMK